MMVKWMFALALVLLPCAHGQTSNVPRGSTQTAPDQTPLGRSHSGDSPLDDEVTNAYFRHHVEEARKLDRKKRMVDTANRLLALTKQLQDDLKGRAPTPEDDKRLDEIARLARQVKDQMRQ